MGFECVVFRKVVKCSHVDGCAKRAEANGRCWIHVDIPKAEPVRQLGGKVLSLSRSNSGGGGGGGDNDGSDVNDTETDNQAYAVAANQPPIQHDRDDDEIDVSVESKKIPWSEDEDEALRKAVKSVPGDSKAKWTDVAKLVQNRSARRCQERWENNLRPDLKSGPLSEEEITTLRALYRKYKQDIRTVANHFPNRGFQTIKTFFCREELEEKKQNDSLSVQCPDVQQSAAAVAARAQPPQRQVLPVLSCPLCDKVVITALGGTGKHTYNCVFQGFVSLFNLKKKGSLGGTRSQCAWMRLQNEEWVSGIRAALRRSYKKKSVIVLRSDAVVEKEDGQLERSFALPRVVTVREIKDFATNLAA
jgi:hypothetical protein